MIPTDPDDLGPEFEDLWKEMKLAPPSAADLEAQVMVDGEVMTMREFVKRYADKFGLDEPQEKP